jgi:hypothetical protein
LPGSPDQNGTFGLLLQSPEPISLTSDVTLSLTRQPRVWVSASAAAPAPGPAQLVRLATASPAAPPDSRVALALKGLTFGSGQLELPAAGLFPAGAKVVRVATAGGRGVLEIYDPSTPDGETSAPVSAELPLAQALQIPEYAPIAGLPPGSVTVVLPDGSLGSVQYGYYEYLTITVPFTALTNGAENAILVLSDGGSPLPSGNYSLLAKISRDRWPATSVTDPEQQYQDNYTIELQW